jgi:hypothetical protein
MTSVAANGLDLILFFVINKVRWWMGEVVAVFFCLDIWGKEGCVENGVNGPLVGEVEFVHYWQ